MVYAHGFASEKPVGSKSQYGVDSSFSSYRSKVTGSVTNEGWTLPLAALRPPTLPGPGASSARLLSGFRLVGEWLRGFQVLLDELDVACHDLGAVLVNYPVSECLPPSGHS